MEVSRENDMWKWIKKKLLWFFLGGVALAAGVDMSTTSQTENIEGLATKNVQELRQIAPTGTIEKRGKFHVNDIDEFTTATYQSTETEVDRHGYEAPKFIISSTHKDPKVAYENLLSILIQRGYKTDTKIPI